MRLCYSRMQLVQIFPRESQEMVFEAHERAFHFFGGVCRRGIYDVNVPSARDGGVTGIMNPVVMNADKGAGNTERHALSSSAWRFATRILNQA